MDKWADYLISAVRYDQRETHIEKARIHQDLGNQVGQAQEWIRDQVVSAIQRGRSFVTIRRSPERKWLKGEEVHILQVGNDRFIRTDRNSEARDNLGELPVF
jgi:hypothetical protein